MHSFCVAGGKAAALRFSNSMAVDSSGATAPDVPSEASAPAQTGNHPAYFITTRAVSSTPVLSAKIWRFLFRPPSTVRHCEPQVGASAIKTAIQQSRTYALWHCKLQAFASA